MFRHATALVIGAFLTSPLAAQTQDEQRPLAAAIAALSDGDVNSAYALVSATDPVTRDVLRWLHLRSEAAEAPFAIYQDFLSTRPNWPQRDRIRSNAERALREEGENALAFFSGNSPETAQGAIAFADALYTANRGEEANTMLETFWLNEGLSEDDHQALINAYPDVLQPLHFSRADRMLWRWRTSDAAASLPYISEGEQAFVRARIAIIEKQSDIDALLALVPSRLRDDAGLAYDQFNLRADRGDWTDAIEILRARSTSAEALGIPWRWGSWRRILARWQMREGNGRAAYALASQHFIPSGGQNYADLEWLSGYVALTYLNDPQTALTHFRNFNADVETPISKGRAGYWLGRAHEALNQTDAARVAYASSAEHQISFYGLLSAEKLGLNLDPRLRGGEVFPDWANSNILQNDLLRAALLLLSINERGAAVSFIVDLVPNLSREELGQLGALFSQMEEPFLTILMAKSAQRRGIWLQDALFPLHPLTQLTTPVEPALALAIARQESEFRADAGSAVGALGLMQLMPDTARDVAGWENLPYSRARLTSDWRYNARLGMRYLAYLEEEFGPSPVMIAAGYNAGPSRPKSWMDQFGDPRRGEADVVDWIEHIPFRETRNYVMRVTENLVIYRARLTGDTAPVSFTPLLRGAAPVIRPRARPVTLPSEP